ncbi:hypothetical protein [Salipaludibacillus aurantiacus]|uniref:hypothetical protein n=1 Tax=Salipaludibacillus aurantiacus TaxID=1601833 RepID=UPI000B81F261|nr:hypothetical protein [Salipaludibacillus aurantiacus]
MWERQHPKLFDAVAGIFDAVNQIFDALTIFNLYFFMHEALLIEFRKLKRSAAAGEAAVRRPRHSDKAAAKVIPRLLNQVNEKQELKK